MVGIDPNILMMEPPATPNDVFKVFPFPKETTPLQRDLYAGTKNICSGALVHRKAALQLIWEGAGIELSSQICCAPIIRGPSRIGS